MALGRKDPKVDPRRAGSVEAALRRSLRAAVGTDWATAETWLERIVEADTDDLDAYHALARLYREQGAIGRAIRMHQNLLLRGDLDRETRREALLELARDFDAGGFAERAIAGYEEVLDDAPRQPEALRRLVALLAEARAHDRALALVKRLARIDRSEAEAAERALLLDQARCAIEAGDDETARAALKKRLRRDKACAEALQLLGDLEAERGRDAKAIDAWRRAVEADAGLGSELLPKLEAGYAARDKTRDYEKLLDRLIEERPGDPAVRIARARLLEGRGDLDAAIETLARAVEVIPRDPGLRVELGRRLVDSGQGGEALKAYQDLLDTLETTGFDASPRREGEDA